MGSSTAPGAILPEVSNRHPFTMKAVTSIPFTLVFRDSPHARVLDFLLEEDAPDHTITAIARGAGVARPTVYKVVDDLLSQRLLRETRTVGNSRFFALDARNRAVKELARVAPVLGTRTGRGR